MSAVTLRRAVAGDDDALRRLAERDSAAPLTGDQILIAEAGGAPLAAICLARGTVIADPFTQTAAVVELLRARARQLAGSGRVPPHQPRLRAALAGFVTQR